MKLQIHHMSVSIIQSLSDQYTYTSNDNNNSNNNNNNESNSNNKSSTGNKVNGTHLSLTSKETVHLFFYKQSIFDPCPENSLSFSKKPPQKIV